MRIRPTVLSIAGFDPSGGAGLLADIKTMEMHKVYGLGVMTANTWQNESEFEKTEWLDTEKIISQLEIVLRKTELAFVKIGLIKDAETLLEITSFLKRKNKDMTIVWDPVLRASAGFDFHTNTSLTGWIKALDKISYITPNWDEIKWLANETDPITAAEKLVTRTNIYLKGGHNPDKPGTDYLFYHQNTDLKRFNFRPKSKVVYPKHGSGCVFSSSFTANLAKGFPVKKACLISKDYITRYLLSNKNLLGYHHL